MGSGIFPVGVVDEHAYDAVPVFTPGGAGEIVSTVTQVSKVFNEFVYLFLE